MIQSKRLLFSVGIGIITLAILMVIINPFELDFKLTNPFKNFTFTGLFAVNRTSNETEPLLESLEETSTTSVETTTSTPSTTVLTTTSPVTTTHPQTTTSTSTTTTTVPLANHIVFSEVFYDTPGIESNEEWIELYNPTSDSIDLSGLKIEDHGGSYTIPNETRISHRDFLIIARNQTGFENLYGFSPDLDGLPLSLANDDDELRLKNGSEEIDMVAWGGHVSGWNLEADEDESIQRDPPDRDTDTEDDWINHANPDPETGGLITTTTTPITTTTTTSTTTTTTAPVTTTIPPTIADHLVISEVYYDSLNETCSEFIELYNPKNEDINISGWKIATSTSENDATIPTNSSIKSYGFYLIADDCWYTGKDNSIWPEANYNEIITLGNDNGWVALKDNLGATVDTVGWGSATNYEGNQTVDVNEGKSLERKLGSLNPTAGNGRDSNNNLEDFIQRDSPEPQNSNSPAEIPG